MSTGARFHIAFVNHTGQVSGAEGVLLNLLRGLDATRYRATVVCPENGDLGTAAQKAGAAWVRVPALQARFTSHPGRLLRYMGSVAGAIGRLRRTIRELDPDFIHANTVRAGIVTTLATIGTRRTVLWHVHDILPRHPISTVVRWIAFLSPRTRMIAVSEATARAFSGGLRFDGRMDVIYNGTDLSRFPLKQAGPSPLKTELGLEQQSFLVCAVGQITPRKGIRELLQSFERAAAENQDLHLAIAGTAVFAHDQQYQDEVVAEARNSSQAQRIHFLGPRRDIPSVLRSADLLVLNSREEPFGLVLVEAMSSGTPVLATRVGGIPEIVTDGVNGWLAEKDDTAGLATRLVELSRAPEKLAQAARKAHEATCPRFSLIRFQAMVDALYRQISSLPAAVQHAQHDRALEIQ